MIQHRYAVFATNLSVYLDLIAAHTEPKRASLWPLLDPWLSSRREKTAHIISEDCAMEVSYPAILTTQLP